MSRIIESERDLVRYLTTYPGEMAFGEEGPEAVLDRYHAPDIVIVNDGIELDRQRLIDHAAPARKRVAAVAVEVADALVDGDRVAARYVLSATMRKGQEIVTRIHMFGCLADDGRLRRVEQITRNESA